MQKLLLISIIFTFCSIIKGESSKLASFINQHNELNFRLRVLKKYLFPLKQEKNSFLGGKYFLRPGVLFAIH